MKLDTSLREEVMELFHKSSESPNDFMGRILHAYKLHKAVEAFPIAQQEINNLTTHFAGIGRFLWGCLKEKSATIMAKEQESRLIIEELASDLFYQLLAIIICHIRHK